MNNKIAVKIILWISLITLSLPMFLYIYRSISNTYYPNLDFLWIPCNLLLGLLGLIGFHTQNKLIGTTAHILTVLFIILLFFDIINTYP